MTDILQWLSFLSAACAAIVCTIGGIKARSLQPDSLPNIREIVEILEEHLSASKHLFTPTLEHIHKTKGLSAPLTSSTVVGFEIAEESVRKLHDRLTTWKVLNTSDVVHTAVSARLWMIGGSVFASMSITFQALSYILK